MEKSSLCVMCEDNNRRYSRGGTRRVRPDALPRTSAGGLRGLFMFPESHDVSQERVSPLGKQQFLERPKRGQS